MIRNKKKLKLSRDEFISRLYHICCNNIISEEALLAFNLLYIKLRNQKATPQTFALLAHEIGHLDASFCNDAVVHSIRVSGRRLKYHGYEDDTFIWRYSFNPFKINSSYTYAFSQCSNPKELKDSLEDMYREGLVYTDFLMDLQCGGHWRLKNYVDQIFLKAHFNKNTFDSKQSKHGDVSVINQLSKMPDSALAINERLKKLCI